MFIRWVLPILALAGFFLAVRVVIASSKPVLPANVVTKPSVSPFEHYISGAGIVEASTENIAISTNIAGVVSEVFVTPGQTVKSGEPLFRIDDRQSVASLQVEEAALKAAEAELTVAIEASSPGGHHPCCLTGFVQQLQRRSHSPVG